MSRLTPHPLLALALGSLIAAPACSTEEVATPDAPRVDFAPEPEPIPDPPPEPAKPRKAEFESTCVEVSKEFSDNKLAAEMKYLTKTFKLTGRVAKIDEDFGAYYVYCKGVSGTRGVKALVSDSETAKLASLSMGQDVSFTGTASSADSYDLTMVDVFLHVEPSSPAQSSTPIEVTSRQVGLDVESNMLSARQKYVGRLVTVTGPIAKIDEDYGAYYVYLKGSDSTHGVKVWVADSSKVKLAESKVGDTVTLVGSATSVDSYDLTVSDGKFK